MAARRLNRTQGPQSTVGSDQWVERELHNMDSMIENDMEDFAYEARRELEWLNEHLTDIIDRNTT